MKIGDGVKQVVHAIEGVISRKQYDETSDGFIYQVDYTDADNELSHRWFIESEIELNASALVAVAPVIETGTEIGKVAE